MTGHLGSAGRATILIVAASGAFTAGVYWARAKVALPVYGGMMAFRLWLWTSTLLAIAFAAVRASEYYGFLDQQLGPSANRQMAVYFLLTGVHLLLVAGGIVVNLWLMLTPSRTSASSAPMVVKRLETAAYYWYFLSIVWLVIVVVLYIV